MLTRYNGLTNEHYQLFGKIAVSSAALEHTIKLVLAMMVFKDTNRGLEAFADYHFSRVFDVLKRIAPASFDSMLNLGLFQQKLEESKSLMGQRDLNIHALWDFNDLTQTITRLKLRKKPNEDKKIFDEKPITPEFIGECEKLDNDIQSLQRWFLVQLVLMIREAQSEKAKDHKN